MLSTKIGEGEDAVDVEDAGKVHVRQERGNGMHRAYLASMAETAGVPGLKDVASALRGEAGDATVALETLKAAGLPAVHCSTFMRHNREGFQSRKLDASTVVPPPRDPLVNARCAHVCSL